MSLKTFMEEYETTKQVAERLGVNDSRVRQLLIAGRFPEAVKTGRDWWIPKGAVPRPPNRGRKVSA